MKASVEKMVFTPGKWGASVNVQDFVLKNITPYEGDSSFLSGPSAKTTNLWNICKEALLKERANNGCSAIDVETISTINAFKPGYINKEDEVVVSREKVADFKAWIG